VEVRNDPTAEFAGDADWNAKKKIHRGVAESAEMLSCDMGILPMLAIVGLKEADQPAFSDFRIASTGEDARVTVTVLRPPRSLRLCGELFFFAFQICVICEICG
jgi:hypothetical protein